MLDQWLCAHKDLAPWGSWISATVSLFAITLGWRFAEAYRRRQWGNQKLTEKRIHVFDAVAPLLNDFFCYFMQVGEWKSFEPPKLLAAKRICDKIINVNRYLFSPALWNAYQAYIHTCYATWNGPGVDAQLRMSDLTKNTLANWQPAWQDYFSTNNHIQIKDVERSYRKLMKTFASEIGIR